MYNIIFEINSQISQLRTRGRRVYDETIMEQNQQPMEEKTAVKPPAKTNWKFLAIIVAVEFVISGGLILFNLLPNLKETQSTTEVYNQSGQPLQHVILKQGDKTQVVIPKSNTKQNQDSIPTHDNSPCAFQTLAYDYYLDTYIVQKGDTLLSIARTQSGSTSRVNELIQLNQGKHSGLSMTNPFIEVGWELYLPPKFQKSSTGKLFGIQGRIIDQNESVFQIGTSSSMPVGSAGLLAFKRDTTKYFGKDKFEIGDCVTIVFDDHSITLTISPQDKNYFTEARNKNSMDNWQTYSNEEFGFEVKYYSESEPQENIGNEINGQFTYLLLVRFGTNPIKSTYGYELRVNKRQSLNSYREELVGHITDKIDSEEQIVINDNTWTKINYQIFLTTDYVPVTMVITNHGGYTYAITSSAVDTDQILSTFRFVR